jgi:hypothetical protein
MSTPRTFKALAGSLALAACWPNPSEKGDYIDPTSGTTATSEPTTTTTTTTTTHGPTSVITLDTSTDDTTAANTSTTGPTSCGDGMTNEGEECDDGNDDNTDNCLDTCENAKCGDGFIQTGVDECDDGNDVDDDDCTNACMTPVCGDNIVQSSEECDDGDDDNTDDCVMGCKNAVCGDAFVQTRVEACDDGIENDYDACSNDCQPRRYVFLSSESYNGNFAAGDTGDLKKVDAKCQGLAETAMLPGKFKAWLSGKTDSSSPSERFARDQFMGWYVLPGDPPQPVAKGWEVLTTASQLTSAIIRTEYGQTIVDSNVWTNTSKTGGRIGDVHCDGWTSTNGNGTVGRAEGNTKDAMWTDRGPVFCNTPNRLYCFQTSQ